MNKKTKILLFVILILFIIIVSITTKNNDAAPPNSFGITAKDSFCLSHFYNVNGVVGYQKTEFTDKEKGQILDFLASLDNEEVLETVIDPEDMLYGIPPCLIICKADSETEYIFYIRSKIELEERDKEENIISRKSYTTTKGQLQNIDKLLGLSDKERR